MRHRDPLPPAPPPPPSPADPAHVGPVVVTGQQRLLLVRAAALARMDVPAYLRQAVLDRVRRDLRAAAPGIGPDVADDHADSTDRARQGATEAATAVVAGLTGDAGQHTARTWRWQLPHQVPAQALVQLPARARTLARTALEGYGLDGQGDVCMLLITELVTNAIRHGGPGPVTVHLALDAGVLVCGVSDTSRDSPVPGHADVDDEGGRGLPLLAQLSSRCGWFLTSAGKTVWFAQRLRRAPADAARSAAQAAFPATAGPVHPLLPAGP